jgi:hypothetical protein
MRALLLVLPVIVSSACSSPAPIEPQPGLVERIRTIGWTKVDLLFVVDTSPSMAGERELLVAQLELMARSLVVPDDPTRPGVHDLHLGVVAADMDDPIGGGVFRAASRLADCEESYGALDCHRDSCPWLSHSFLRPDDGTDPENPPLWDDLACIAGSLDTGGTVEQPVAAAIAALTTQSEPGMPNEGFLRSDSLLAIIFVTDEDDCSGLSLADDIEPGVECLLHEDLLTQIDDVRDTLMELRGGDMNRIVVAAIAGVPVDGSWNPGDPIEQLRELRRIEGTGPAPSCETGTTLAYPPVRLAELVYAFENNGILESICRDDWTPALTAITRCTWVCDGLLTVCFDRILSAGSATSCRVVQTMADGAECLGVADAPGPDRTRGWSVDLGADEAGNHRCEILSADPDEDGCPDGAAQCPPSWAPSQGGLDGWFIDTTGASHGGLGCLFDQMWFTDPLITELSSDILIECDDAPCPAARSCPRALVDAPTCFDVCADGEVCVAHYRGEYALADTCDWLSVKDPETGETETLELPCHSCSPLVGSACSSLEEARDAPLVGPGGCCAEGFHCDGDRCVPDRATECATSG